MFSRSPSSHSSSNCKGGRRLSVLTMSAAYSTWEYYVHALLVLMARKDEVGVNRHRLPRIANPGRRQRAAEPGIVARVLLCRSLQLISEHGGKLGVSSPPLHDPAPTNTIIRKPKRSDDLPHLSARNYPPVSLPSPADRFFDRRGSTMPEPATIMGPLYCLLHVPYSSSALCFNAFWATHCPDQCGGTGGVVKSNGEVCVKNGIQVHGTPAAHTPRSRRPRAQECRTRLYLRMLSACLRLSPSSGSTPRKGIMPWPKDTMSRCEPNCSTRHLKRYTDVERTRKGWPGRNHRVGMEAGLHTAPWETLRNIYLAKSPKAGVPRRENCVFERLGASTAVLAKACKDPVYQ